MSATISPARKAGKNGRARFNRDMANTMGEFVKMIREDLGLTGTELAIGSGLTRSEISAIEHGRLGLPNATKRRHLAQALGVRHVDLLVAGRELLPEEVAEPSAAPEEGMIDKEVLALLRQVDINARDRKRFLLIMLRDWVAQDSEEGRFNGDPPLPSAKSG